MESTLASGRARRLDFPFSVRGVLGSLSLAGIVGVSLAVVMAAAERRSFLSPTSHAGFPSWMSGPLGGLLPGLTHDLQTLKVEFTVAVAGMYVLYLIALLCVRAIPTWAVLATVAAVHVVFFLSPPLPLTDIFNYLHYARMGALHGLNPYVHLPIAGRHDSTYPLTTWHHLRSPYGPLFTLGTYALAPLPVPVAYWVFKGAVMSAGLGCVALVWLCAKRLGRSPRAAVLFAGLNPLYCVYGLGGQHNDVFMMLLVLAGVYLFLRSREHFGGAALAAAVAVKASAGVLLPVVLIGARQRGRALVGAAAGVAAMGALTLVAFGPHLPNDAAQSKLVVPFGLTNELGLALGFGGVSPGLRHVLEALLATGVAAACLVAWRGSRAGSERSFDWIPAAAGASLVLVLTLTWVMPWYVFWAVPLAALAKGRALRVAAIVVGALLLYTWLPLGQDFNHKTLQLAPTRTAVGRQNSNYLHNLLR